MKKTVLNFILSGLMIGLLGISANAQSTLIHYWNFNSAANATIAVHLPAIYPVHADFSIIDTSKAKLVYQPFTPVSASYASYVDFSTTAVTDSDIYNLRNGDLGGYAIRLRNPADSMEARFYIPTTSYKNIVFKFVAQASSATNGAKNQLFDYSIDSGATWRTTGLSILKDSVKTYFSLVTVSFDTTANNKRVLVFRMKFAPANTGTSGNDRLDNVTVEGDSIAIPTVTLISGQIVCNGSLTTPVTFTGPVAGTTFTWTNNNTSAGLSASGTGNLPAFTATNTGTTPLIDTITVTPTAGGVTGPAQIFTITVNPTPTVSLPSNQVVGNSSNTTAITFTGAVAGTTYNWTNTNTSIGLGANGTGNIGSFTAINFNSSPATGTISVTPTANSCSGTPVTFTITVNPPTPPSTLIHYWNFNNPANATIAVHLPSIYPVHADLSIIDTSKAKIVYQPYTTVSASYASYLDFAAVVVADSDLYNLRNGDTGGYAIRFRNPSDSMEARFYIPTTNYKNIVLKFVAEASSASNGAKNQLFDYSVDSGATWKTTGLSILKDSVKIYYSLVTVTFDTNANNKRGLIFRMKFGPANTGTSGNNRMDNVTVEGDPFVPVPPTVNLPSSQVVCNGSSIAPVSFSGPLTGTTFAWTSKLTSIGIAAAGAGNIAAFTAINTGTTAVIDTITVTPTANAVTGAPVIFTITVNPAPSVTASANQVICNGTATSAVIFTGTVAGSSFSWTNSSASIGLGAAGTGSTIASFTAVNTGTSALLDTIRVTPSANSCIGTSKILTITVNPSPAVTPPANQVVVNGGSTAAVTFVSGVTGATFAWTNTATSIGLAATGTGNIASFTAINTGATPVVATIMVTPAAGSCQGTPATFTITVNPTVVTTVGLIHYWHFNTLLTAFHNPGIPAIPADFSILSPNHAEIDYSLKAGTSAAYAGYIDNVAGDTLNARQSAPAGQALRVRNPTDSMTLNFKIPTTGYKNIVIKYALQSSSITSGMLAQLFDYSIDNGATWKTSGLNMTIDSVTQPQFQQAAAFGGPVSINFGTDTNVNNNANLVFRIAFAGNTNLTSGNNRFDNVTVEGIVTTDTSHPNAVTTVSSQTNSLSIYPNPATGIVNIATDFDGAKSVAILNMTGQRIYYNEYTGKTLSVDISHLNAGMYLIEVLDNITQVVHISRFVKQ